MIRVIRLNNIEDARKAIAMTGADPYSVGIMAPKALFRALLIEHVDNRAAALIKQEMLSIGAEAAVSEKVSRFDKGSSHVLLMGTLKNYRLLTKKLANQPFGLITISKEIETVLSNHENETFVLKAGKFDLRLGNRVLVMGILNITPDSFSDGGLYYGSDEAVNRALQMEHEGADIIDIGGESTKPGAKTVTEKEEINRVLPVIKKLSKEIKIPISIDTYKPGVAKAAVGEGASIINDITALRYGGRSMARVTARSGAAVILMHMLGTPRTMQKSPRYNDLISDINGFLAERVSFAESSGIKRSQVLIDPGIGFGKTVEHNLEILKKLKEFKNLGIPIVAGLSRKNFIGQVLGGVAPNERLAGSLTGNIWVALNGANIVRVHDVKETAQALKVLKSINC